MKEETLLDQNTLKTLKRVILVWEKENNWNTFLEQLEKFEYGLNTKWYRIIGSDFLIGDVIMVLLTCKRMSSENVLWRCRLKHLVAKCLQLLNSLTKYAYTSKRDKQLRQILTIIKLVKHWLVWYNSFNLSVCIKIFKRGKKNKCSKCLPCPWLCFCVFQQTK